MSFQNETFASETFRSETFRAIVVVEVRYSGGKSLNDIEQQEIAELTVIILAMEEINGFID